MIHGFLRVAAATPELRPADPRRNASRTLDLLREAETQGVELVVFPELGLVGYTSADLLLDTHLQHEALIALGQLRDATATLFSGIAIVGFPLASEGRLFNCAAVLAAGEILGIVPKTYLPNSREFYERRWFAPARAAVVEEVTLFGEEIPFGTDLLFASEEGFTVGVELCEDLWRPVPPSSLMAMAGASVLVNLSASNETIGKAAYRRDLVAQQSGRTVAAYVYSAAGVGESTTDLVFGGHALIAENGQILVESERFRPTSALTIADVDIERLDRERAATGVLVDELDPPVTRGFRSVSVPARTGPRPETAPELVRFIDPAPFVPSHPATRDERCDEIFNIQTAALTARWDRAGRPPLVLGVSGGLDSTLALVVACRMLDQLGEPRTRLATFTMPGFGTTARSRDSALSLMTALGTCIKTIDIRAASFATMKALGHAPFGISLENLDLDMFLKVLDTHVGDKHDLVFENVQARTRTELLMNAGFVIGTGDLSELALGWSTYNADHMSMYNPNAGVPKTLVKFLVQHAAEKRFDGEIRRILQTIASAEISPELLPVSAGVPQSTEGTIGPYELHDFFLFHFVRYGTTPEKIRFLARHARFSRCYEPEEIDRVLRIFLKRFFAAQYKRSCLPDGPKVGSVCLSPRGDWRMPSDATAQAWLEE